MPELPEVETVRRGLADVMDGKRIAGVEQRRANLRFPFPDRFCDRLASHRIDGLRRRAKYLLIDLSSGETLIVHLGMTGRFEIRPASGGADRPGAFAHVASIEAPHLHVLFHLDDGTDVAFFDPRRFGFMDLIDAKALEAHSAFRSLGIEPLSTSLTPKYLQEAFAGRSVTLKAALLDQRRIAGLGNIYVCEALFRARLSPKRQAGSVGPARAARLVAAITSVLEDAIAAGGSTLRDFAQVDGDLGYFQHEFAVYGRAQESCHNQCGARIRRIVQNGRSTFYCPTCQR